LTLRSNITAGGKQTLGHHLAEIFPLAPISPAYAFVLLIFLIVTYASLALSQLDKTSTIRWNLMVILSVLCLDGVLFYLSVLTFAIGVYPRISATKGGGGYTDASSVRVVFKKDTNANDFPSPITKSSSPFVVLYETSDALFVADSTEAEGPANWQKPGSQKPTVYELRREAIIGVIYSNQPPIPTPTPPESTVMD